jgi:hypothetical protein
MSLHKTDLSTTTSITTSYAGEFAGTLHRRSFIVCTNP